MERGLIVSAIGLTIIGGAWLFSRRLAAEIESVFGFEGDCWNCPPDMGTGRQSLPAAGEARLVEADPSCGGSHFHREGDR
jgi:hypothetical protein